jgi:hypothetical protein
MSRAERRRSQPRQMAEVSFDIASSSSLLEWVGRDYWSGLGPRVSAVAPVWLPRPGRFIRPGLQRRVQLRLQRRVQPSFSMPGLPQASRGGSVMGSARRPGTPRSAGRRLPPRMRSLCRRSLPRVIRCSTKGSTRHSMSGSTPAFREASIPDSTPALPASTTVTAPDTTDNKHQCRHPAMLMAPAITAPPVTTSGEDRRGVALRQGDVVATIEIR